MPGCVAKGVARRRYPMSEVGAQPREATPHPRSGPAAGRSYPLPEARVGGQEELPHVQGVVTVRVQKGLEELLHVQGHKGRQ